MYPGKSIGILPECVGMGSGKLTHSWNGKKDKMSFYIYVAHKRKMYLPNK